MPRALLIVDPQYDFINGTLPVPGAVEAMHALANHIADNNGLWSLKIITCDFHPWNHCSFRENGGQWPRHCVAHTGGAALWDELLASAFATQGEVHVLPKAESPDKEEYSIFQAASAKFGELVAGRGIDSVDICGIAGDICVLNTLRDGVALYGRKMFNVLAQFSPSLDCGKALAAYCDKEEICTR